MSPNDIKRFVDEVVHESPGLAAHRSVLDGLAQRIVEEGLEVATRYDAPVSSVTRPEQGQGGIIRLNAKVGDDALWDLAHELGHLDAPPIAGRLPDEQLLLEEAAWKRGWEILAELDPGLAARRSDYEARRDLCLSTYRRAAHAAHARVAEDESGSVT